jgi:hypothetical protein
VVNAKTMARRRDEERIYEVTWGEALAESSEEVKARNAGEAVWLVHAQNKHPEGTQYIVVPVDKSEPPRNFTVGHAPRNAPFSE